MASGSPCVNSRWDRREAGVIASESCVSHDSSSADASGAPQGGVEMAAAMAAKINAMLMAKGKLKPLQPLPSKALPAVPPVAAEELVVAEVDINDVPMECRNLLTKGKTQDEIGQLSGALVSTKGLYMSDADRSSCAGERTLYLHVQGRRQEEVNKAVSRIKQIISENVLRSSGGQQPPVMPTVPVYRQTVPGHKPAPPHTGVKKAGPLSMWSLLIHTSYRNRSQNDSSLQTEVRVLCAADTCLTSLSFQTRSVSNPSCFSPRSPFHGRP